MLDPAMRYGQPGQLYLYDDTSERFDPFDAFGLDSDEAPEAADPDDRFASRKVPSGAWDGFASTDEDRRDLPETGAGRFRVSGADTHAKLPIRLWPLGVFPQTVDRKSSVQGQSVSIREDPGGRRSLQHTIH